MACTATLLFWAGAEGKDDDEGLSTRKAQTPKLPLITGREGGTEGCT